MRFERGAGRHSSADPPAAVGVQPCGGEGLSGSGLKAGGPHYLPRFCAGQTLTLNTTAAGGNVALLTTA